MKLKVDYEYTKRNGNGHTTCLLCHKLTWDTFCYDVSIKLLDKSLIKTIFCCDCIVAIKNKQVEELEDNNE